MHVNVVVVRVSLAYPVVDACVSVEYSLLSFMDCNDDWTAPVDRSIAIMTSWQPGKLLRRSFLSIGADLVSFYWEVVEVSPAWRSYVLRK